MKGAIDNQTRCEHYHNEKDRIAIKFYCCQQYFPCHQCHELYGCGKKERWPVNKFNEKAIFCGSCRSEISIDAYLHAKNKCPFCDAAFNPGCARHYHYYFQQK